jgi:hypothetical protein
MDMSKLPRLSNTSTTHEGSANPPPGEPVAPVPTVRQYNPRPSFGSDAWLSIGIGLFLLLYQPRFLQWVSSRLFHTGFEEPLLDPYQRTWVFWSDLGPTLFAVVLIIEGLVLGLSRNRITLAAAMALTALSTLFNLVWLVLSYSQHGLAALSFLAVMVGIFIFRQQWVLFQLARQEP